MAPPRQRTAAIVDDSRSEASSGTRELKTSAPKSRKTGTAAKEKASVTSAPLTTEQPIEEQPRVPWSDLPLDILHAYRHVHKLPTPSAFSTDYSRLILSQGVGLRSPTALAARRAQSSRSSTRERNGTTTQDAESSSSLHRIVGQDRVSKDQFALVVRKHFNSAGLSEQESIARFLYTVREERRGRQFRLRFQP
ncbi:uncharacterized protein N7458_008538 [Penicillium daleae]|uniref:Histone deacetylase complex subunit SAP30 Sin3 binding domain-containing protein n=1 Tax=Penicillium daleae TaxID=63821 RepID=A0AAD6C4K5_9EURO|nr:uncharacterized protein N7458_008538 [Penicillium daleae]KAJ5444666.1 hypothetical protein N7458_008538 [Penicillium daleae]